MLDKNLFELFEESYRKNWDYPALSNYGSDKIYKYSDVVKYIAKWHILFEKLGLQRGDKVALMAKDSAEWSIFFMATITYGAVIVPILQDFPPKDAMGIIDHSDAVLLLVNENIYKDFDPNNIPKVKNIIELQSFKALHSQVGLDYLKNELEATEKDFLAKYPNGITKDAINYYHTPNSELILLNYTSGTTGFSKGVMVSANNIAGNLLFCMSKDIVRNREKLLCFLPMAHTYSCMIHLFLAQAIGIHVIILGKVPTPQILRKAFGEIKPQVIISVPLVLEKIYMNTIMPIIKRKNMQILLNIPFLNKIIYGKIVDKLKRGMGGNLRQVIVGGAALNPEVAKFLKKIGFPVTVGYGMTECAPLISYAFPHEWRLGSCGKVLEGYMEARIADIDEITTMEDTGKAGEIQVRGENVCMGYYKNEEETAKLFTEDGWMHTGDLGTMDKDNFLYIKGRSKTMLLSGNGQNIYPEEIEAKIALLPYVQESLVLMRDGKLEALIVLNELKIKEEGISMEEAWNRLNNERSTLNEHLGSYEKVQKFNLQTEPFIKTPKQSIKRFMYK